LTNGRVGCQTVVWKRKHSCEFAVCFTLQ
jgi:hypothetical protein